MRGNSHSKRGGGGPRGEAGKGRGWHGERLARGEAGKGAGSRSVEPASRIEPFVCTSGQAQINFGSNTHNHL